MKGFKVFNKDWTCKGFKYEVGKTYEHEGELSVCNSGFHFCQRASDCFNYYSFDSNNKVAEVVAYGKILTEGDKSCTNKIEIVRELAWSEVLEIVNIGKNNTGHSNTGDRNTGNSNIGNWNTGYRNTGNRNTGDSNTGNWNTGDSNTGDSNTGYRNTGNRNTGYSNTGDSNTGYRNTGNRNTGDSNTGYSNTGYRNTGNRNTGDSNTGYRNTGYRNTGNRNTGDYNAINFSSGCFCMEEPNIKFFDEESETTMREWRNSSAYSFLPFELTMGWFNRLTKADKSIIETIPNYSEEKMIALIKKMESIREDGK